MIDLFSPYLIFAFILVAIFIMILDTILNNHIMKEYRLQVCVCGCTREQHIFYMYACLYHRPCKEFCSI